MSNIIITSCELTTPKEDVFAMAKNDQKLIDAITEFKKERASNNIETFEQKDNIIVTEEGYYCAFWDYELAHADE